LRLIEINFRSKQRENGTQLAQKKKTENHIGYENRKTASIFSKTENQMLKNEKYANRNGHENRKTDLKTGQNRKTENPNAPLL